MHLYLYIYIYAHKCLNVCAYEYIPIMHITRDIGTYIYAYKDVIKLTCLLKIYEDEMNENEGKRSNLKFSMKNDKKEN